MNRSLIVGAGGHAAVVADGAGLQGKWNVICFNDQRYPGVSQVIGLPVVGDMTSISAPSLLRAFSGSGATSIRTRVLSFSAASQERTSNRDLKIPESIPMALTLSARG